MKHEDNGSIGLLLACIIMFPLKALFAASIPTIVCLGNCSTGPADVTFPAASLPVNQIPAENVPPERGDATAGGWVPGLNCMPAEVEANITAENEANAKHKIREGRGDGANFTGLMQRLIELLNQFTQTIQQLVSGQAQGGNASGAQGGGTDVGDGAVGAGGVVNHISALPVCPTNMPGAAHPSRQQAQPAISQPVASGPAQLALSDGVQPSAAAGAGCSTADGNIITVGAGAQYQTIQQAADAATAGTTICVSAGTYHERVHSSSSDVRYVCETKWACKISPTDNVGCSGWGCSHAWRNTGSNVEINGFEIAPGQGGGINVGIYITGGSNVKVQYNKIHSIIKSGMGVGPGGITAELGSSNVDVNGNVVYDIGESGNLLSHCIYLTGTGNVTSNITSSCSGAGIHLWHRAHNNIVANNTTFNNDCWGIVFGGEGATADGAKIVNNISYGNGVGIGVNGQVGRNNIISNNLVSNNTKNGGCYCIVGDWQLEAGNTERNSIAMNPMFADYLADGVGDYRLQPGSPAMGKADPQYAPPTDADGNPRSSPPNLGAY